MTSTDRIEISSRTRRIVATSNGDGTFRVARYLLGIPVFVARRADKYQAQTLLMSW